MVFEMNFSYFYIEIEFFLYHSSLDGFFYKYFKEYFITLICIGMVLLTSQGRFILDHPQIMKKYLLFLTY